MAKRTMVEEGSNGRRWLRPLGLFALVLALAVGHPLVLVGVPFALLSFLAPGPRLRSLIAGAVVFALIFAGAPSEGLWHLERGWTILAGGWFVAVTMAWPGLPLVQRSLLSVGGATAWGAGTLLFLDGWSVAQRRIQERLDAGAAATLDLVGGSLEGSGDGVGQAFSDAVVRTAELQGLVFPALLALATVAALAVAWWLHLRLAAGSDRGLGPLRLFRFPDPLIWVLVGGFVLVAFTGWSEGWGRFGTNLIVFMGGLYALRGAGVVLFFTGGLSLTGGILVGVAAILAPPLILAGTMALGVGDSWFDLRSRRRPPDAVGSD